MNKNSTKLFGLALGAAACLPVFSQNTVQQMTIHLKDGTTEKIKVESIKEVDFTPSEEESLFTMKDLNAYEYYIKFTIAPSDPTMTYNAMYLEKEEFDNYESEEAVVADDLQYFQDYADYYDMELSELLPYWLYSGDLSEYILDAQPDTEYVIWYYGMDANGTQTTPFEKIVVKTPKLETIANTLSVEAAAEGTTATLKITPDDNSLRYFTGVLPASSAANEEEMRVAMQSTICDNLTSYVYDLGKEDTDCLNDITYTGARTQTFENLTAGTEYYLMAGYVNEHLAIVSPLAYQKVTATGTSSSAATTRVQEKGDIVKAATLRPAMKPDGIKRHTLRPLTLRK